MASVSIHPALVVGAGPVGLTAALALRAQGIPVAVLETGAEDRQRPGSRAIFYHRQTLQLWESLRPGLGWEIRKAGIVWRTKRTFWGSRQVYERTYPAPKPDEWPNATNLSQIDVEHILYKHCQEAGVRFAWNQEISDTTTTSDGVLLRTASGKEWQARYVIAADGSRSRVRESVGIKLEGPRIPDAFVIVDVAEDSTDPVNLERRYYYYHPAVQKRNVLVVPFRNGIRVDIQLRRGDDPNRFNDLAGVKRWLPCVLPPKYAERVTWVSTYHFMQAVADSFTDANRRILLAGEAAHVFAPFGARGLNSGVPDVIAAAGAISKALESSTAEKAHAAIEEAAVARRNAALYNRNASNLALQHMRAEGWGIRLKRTVAAWGAAYGTRLGAYLDSAPFGPRAADKKGDGGIY